MQRYSVNFLKTIPFVGVFIFNVKKPYKCGIAENDEQDFRIIKFILFYTQTKHHRVLHTFLQSNLQFLIPKSQMLPD